MGRTVYSVGEALRLALERYDAMPAEEQEAMWKAQRESWRRAFTTPCEHGELDFEQCAACRSLPTSGSGAGR